MKTQAALPLSAVTGVRLTLVEAGPLLVLVQRSLTSRANAFPTALTTLSTSFFRTLNAPGVLLLSIRCGRRLVWIPSIVTIGALLFMAIKRLARWLVLFLLIIPLLASAWSVMNRTTARS